MSEMGSMVRVGWRGRDIGRILLPVSKYPLIGDMYAVPEALLLSDGCTIHQIAELPIKFDKDFAELYGITKDEADANPYMVENVQNDSND